MCVKVAFIKSADLFLIRHSKGRYLRWTAVEDVDRIGWSVRLLQDVSSRFLTVTIFNDVAREVENNAVWPKVSIRDIVKTLESSNVKVVDFNSLKPAEAMETWKRRIIELGGYWDKAVNHLNSNYMELDKHTGPEFLIWIGAEGSQEFGIFPDRLNSFLDLARDRESKAIW